ncbi:MAG: DedA family protein [Geminicoccaceae bacterium]
MNLEHLFAQYGYLALVFGSIADGTPVMLFGGFAAHRGWLALPLVILAGAAGSFLAGAAWFLAARRLGERLLALRPRWAEQVARVRPRLERWDAPVLLGVRFVPGLSIVGLLAAGLYGVPVARFMALNAVAALGWAAAYGTLGYLLGHAVERVLGGIQHYERPVALVLLALTLVWIAVAWLRRWRRTATDERG